MKILKNNEQKHDFCGVLADLEEFLLQKKLTICFYCVIDTILMGFWAWQSFGYLMIDVWV